MSIELTFVTESDPRPRVEFELNADEPQVVLPAPVITNRTGQEILVAAVRLESDPPATGLTRLWRPGIPANGVRLAADARYLAPWRRVRGTVLPAGYTRFRWTVEIAGRPAVHAECTLLVHSPAPQPPKNRKSEAVRAHDGWLAIDFGTSNSTITLYDQSQKRALIGIAPTQLAVLRDRLSDLLNGTATDLLGVSADRWRQALESAGRTLAAGLPGDRIVDPLTLVKESLTGDRVFDVLLALEQEDALAQALQRLYKAAFGDPPIEELQLFPVDLHAGQPSVSSEGRVLSLSPLRVALNADEDSVRPKGESVPVAVEHQPALKRFLGDSRPLPGLPAGVDSPTTDDAMTELWWRLLEKVNKFRQARGRRFGDGDFVRAVVTYPTTAPPQTRLDMARLAQSVGLRIVDTRFDEATAAAMFSLLREFAGDQAVGIESFRARSRQVQPGRWHHNVLVIDVGGGSTDVVLLGLALSDRTDFDTRVPTDRQGRYYELRPTVLGKNGNLQLGGDRITLGIFHRIKARVADRLLTDSPGLVVGEYPPYLEGGVYREGSLLLPIGSDDHEDQTRRDLIDLVVPTRWRPVSPGADERDTRERFKRLWDSAENAKRATGPFTLRNLNDIVQLGAAPAEITVDHDEILGEIDAVLERSMDIGLTIARLQLPPGTDGAPEPLDMVILSGGTSALPRAHQLLQKVFTSYEAERPDGGSLGWNPLRVSYDPAFAKLGTSIGACWAEHIRQKGFTDPAQAKHRVAQGQTELYIDVDNLLHSLPYGLEYGGQTMNMDTVFPAGTEFERIGEDGHGAKRSAWLPAVPDLSIFRKPFSPEDPLQLWGHLSLEQYLLGQPEPVDLDQWLRSVRVQFEIDESDLLTAYFCAGDPCYDLDLANFPADAEVTDGQRGLRQDLLVNPDSAGGMANAGRVLLSKDTPPDGYVASPGDPQPLACWVSPRFPRETPADQTWWIGRRDPADPATMHQVGRTIPAGPRQGRGADTRIVVDEKGRMRAVRGFVPYLAAESMADVVTRRGRVLKVPMDPGRIELNDRFDPFNGTH